MNDFSYRGQNASTDISINNTYDTHKLGLCSHGLWQSSAIKFYWREFDSYERNDSHLSL
jgi:hypothetical protein